jgi:hypothetical protein
VRARERRDHPLVTLVRHDHHAAGLGDTEVHAGDADVRPEELVAELCAGERAQLGGHVGQIAPSDAVEEFRNVGARLVQCRRDDVRRRLARQLDDPLAEVGLDDFDPLRLEGSVQVDLLGGHRLRLHGQLRARAPSNGGHTTSS